MKMQFPSMDYKEKAIDLMNEFHEYGSDTDGSGSLNRYLRESTYEEWLKKVISDMDIANVEKSRVPALTYFYVREEDDRIVGMINIRLGQNDFIRKEAGHIGYSVRPTERRKHYGTEMLKCGLEVCRRIGKEYAVVSCDKDNAGSAGVIRNCGGVLEEELYSETFKAVIQRYVIRVEDKQ